MILLKGNKTNLAMIGKSTSSKFHYFTASVILIFILNSYLHAQTNVSGNQSGTWLKVNSPYVITGSVIVPVGQTLTIQPGCKVFMTYGGNINVNGTLLANGNISDSIYFIGGKQGTSLSYGGYMDINSTSSNSSFNYVSLDSLAYNGYPISSARSFSISNSSIKNSGNSYSIYLSSDTISPVIQNCTFNSTDNARSIYGNLGNVSNVVNNINAIIYLTGNATQNGQLLKQGINSYFKMGNAYINSGKTVTIQPGCKVLMPYGGNLNVNGTLIANGTATDSIYFVGGKQGTSINYGGYMDINTTSSNTSFSYVSIDSLAYNGYPITAARSFSISNSSIKNSGNSYSIYLASDTISPVIQNCTFSSSDNARSIYGNLGNVSNISNNVHAIIYLTGNATQNGSLIKQGFNSYFKMGNAYINSGKTVTIQPGCKVIMPYGGNLTINGTMLANGTASDSIYFIGGKQGTSINYGGYIDINTTSSNTTFSYVSLDSLAYNGYPISAARSFSISNSIVKNSGNSYSIYLSSDTISPVIQNCTFSSSDNARSIYGNIGSVSNISNNINAIIYLTGYATRNGLLAKQGYNSYFKMGNAYINSGKTVTIQPGCKVLMPYGGNLTVNGTLLANGTISDSIYFIGGKQGTSPNYGGYIDINATSDNTSFSYVSLDSLAYNGYPVSSARSFSISNSIVKNSGNSFSIYLSSDTISPVIQNCTFIGNEASRTVYAPAKCFSLITNNTNAILKPTGSVNSNAVWPKQNTNSYYQLDGAININTGNVLTIEPGNLINFSNTSSYLSVSGTLRAQGTETANIQFLKIASTGSGTYGGGVFLNAGSGNHVLSYCTFDKLGGNSGYALGVFTTDASLSNLSISNSSSYGIYVQGASPTITSANITGNPYGVYSASGKPVFNNCNIFANTTYGVFNASGTVADTVDARNCYWGHSSGPKHTTLNPLGLGNQVSNKVKFNPWKVQPANGQILDMGVNAIIKPITGCNLTSADTVRVKLTNYGNITHAGFLVSYRINGGAAVTETVAASMLPGTSQEYTFTQKANFGTPGTYALVVYTSAVSDSIPANDTASITIQHLAGVNAPTNLIPANNTNNISLPVTLNWSAVPDVESYDLYIWKSSLAVPTTPTISGLTQISYTISTNLLQYGTTYSWKVLSKRSNCRAESAVQTFTTLQLPDLVIESISVPPAATSETDIAITWKVKNTGFGNTGSIQWYDLVYISQEPALGSGTDIYIGQYQNFSALNVGESYTSANITYHIPQGWQGNYYVIIKTNYSNSLTEASDTNNRRVSVPINVSLAPPPDLQVTNVVVNPSTAFSEDSITVSYTAQNLGTGPTTVSNWTDVIFLTTDTLLNTATATSLFSVQNAQSLAINGTYTITKKVKLPAQISGTYYVHVFADRYNQVFEYIREENNAEKSLPINIILRPFPNLTVQNLTVSGDTVSGNQPISLQWATHNDGAATAKPFWYEAIYYSPTATFNSSTAVQIGGITRNDSIASLSSLAGQATVQLPANLTEGTYYFFVKTDASNQVFESTGETDNLSTAAGPLVILSPDLKPVALTTPVAATSEETIAVSWMVVNNSNAAINNTSWSDNLYLSTDTILSSNDIALTAQTVNQLLPAGSQYTHQANVHLPQGISGNYYFLIVTDVNHSLYEKLETNNVLYKPVTITLAPWPDLQVSAITVSPTDTIGSILQFQYTVQNSGAGAILNKNFTDFVYLSSVNNVSTSSLTLLSSINQTRTLSSASSYTQAVSLTIPTSLSAGTYYVIVSTDVSNQVYENTGENNNKAISTGITMTSIPQIDLSVTAGQLFSSTVTAGQTASLQWVVKNNSINATVISSWQDAVYLSNNPVLDASDVLLSTFTNPGPLNAGASYTQTQSVTIPNTASGTLYLLVNTDKNNVHTDPNRGNNTLSINNTSGGQTIVITVPPPADLIIPTVTVPSEATVAQPITIGFTVKNSGTGITPISSWTDNIYLSTNYQLDNSDVHIGSLSRSSALAPGDQYSGTITTTLPANLSGNYILIIKTDGSNQVYEPNKNNNLAFGSIYIAAQSPSDLIVSEVTLTSLSQAAGTPITVNWKLRNTGNNTASGYIKEAVYLSTDTLPDATDVLLGTIDGSISLPPQGIINRQLTKILNGVTAGSYHLLVRTDILNNIVELNDNNNIKASADTLQVTIKELLMNIVQSDTLSNNIPIYYRIEVPTSLAGGTMSLKLIGDSAHNAVNRLFIRHGSAPATNQYDFSAIEAFKANQELIVPSLQPGTYYIMALGSDTSAPAQNITLHAKLIPFSVTSVSNNTGGNTGAVTVKITGAKFESSTLFSLRSNTYGVINPAQVYFIDGTKVFVTFNLTNAGIGIYDVVAKQTNGDTTVLYNGFEVVQGPGSIAGNGVSNPGSGTGFVCQIVNIGFEDKLQVDVYPPPSIRASQNFVIAILEYENTGTVDIPAQTRFLLVLTNQVYVGLFISDFVNRYQQLKLELKDNDGPPGILRPGAKGTIRIYVTVPDVRGISSLRKLDFLITE